MKVAIAGCGNISKIHISGIVKIKNVELAAVCDKNQIRAKEFSQYYHVPYYTNFSQMVKDIRPDAVHILTPPQTHAALALEALKSGCHIFVEKPMCLSADEAEEIYEMAVAANRKVGVDHSLLWNPIVKKAMEIVHTGKLGRIIQLNYIVGDDYLAVVKGGYSRWALDLKGGIFGDLISHPIYLIRAFLPSVRMISAQACGTNIYDLRELRVNFSADGAAVNLWMSVNQKPLEYSLRLFGTAGTINIDLRNYNLSVLYDKGFPGPLARIINAISESWQRGMGTVKNTVKFIFGLFSPYSGTIGAVQTFYESLAEGKSFPVSKEDAKAVVQITEDIWDYLEKTSSIQPAVDEKGQKIVCRSASDFIGGIEGENPEVLVTGATGFIGSHLVKKIVSENRKVRVLCREKSNLDALPINDVELAFGNLTDVDSIEKAMKGIKAVYHLAAIPGGDWASHYDVIVKGTRNVLQSAVKCDVRKVIHVSSVGVLRSSSFPNRRMVRENFPLEDRLEARGHYSNAKLMAENIAQEYINAGKLDISIIRPGLVYGPSSKRFLSDAGFSISNNSALVVGLGGRYLGLTYVENLVDALILAERSKYSRGQIYNIVDPDQPTVRRYIKEYRRASGRHFIAFYIPTFIWSAAFNLLDAIFKLAQKRSLNLEYRLRSISRGPKYDTLLAQKELGWKPKVSFKEGINKTFSS